ncbi:MULTISPECIES: preprotein translocase subunit YajC [unclassified Spirosoma]|uniref:preprotein translocase subunit YajC n=1 Tax=unclassified Spirosoma TaxID=2621999 RepID=UPI0009695381|nr:MULTISPECIES: preprotein translocase subunit YajC [unclassified Spirosoma]MBN8821777.1 preprotein translocase subunit YajC [Spirosoma sp.]OJW80732.1 MAG: preprotein translocase subunit YajC [Spirosoma sp. 48-14]
MLSILLQAPAGSNTSMIYNVLLWVGIIGIFYFFMIRPQQKKQKDQKSFIDNLKKGDTVVTIGGLHGKVVSVEAATVTLEVDKGTKLTFERTSISREASVKPDDEKK